MDWIQGNMFKALAKWHYAPARLYTNNDYRNAINNLLPTDYRFLLNDLDWGQLKSDDIIYTHTFYADQLFEKLEKLEYQQFTVITHNADTAADFPPPDNVFWYSTNVNIRYKSVQSIPIGIENDFWLRNKKVKMIKKLENPKKFKNLVYINHNIKTNPAKRQKPYEILQKEAWATVQHGANGQGFDDYLDNIYNHPFVVCPDGNGIDTHRTWECFYMKTIPIQVRNINNQFYTDLPILFIDDWGELNQKFLYDEYMKLTSKEWNLDKMTFEWWKDKICNEKN